ncbi:NPCBM/NEW2 domain-containing protein [Novosphingobium sp. P6W]|uniref:NPCBM/NEW2 domain-containing protein n=1 Tax=Novosphingobium sp. P6W TaxID=1609758 RepID=UPI0005C2B6F5|nr:NPCBM/NEW2 domain-containing protein [Novosphingobium sp. P6W]AXB80150.1 alpha-galactosidase [Novosphingobium sp. P6W]KIS30383.1 alpha-galactosidase [Novosphingobium sp. P6W]
MKYGLLLATTLFLSTSAIAQQPDPLRPTGRWSANTTGQAETPPMGWNSWNAFGTDIDEEKVFASAKAIVDSGLAAKGYRYVNLDEGWWDHRRSDGRMLVRSDKFPSARTADGATSFRPFTNRLHAMGLKAGLYSDLGRNTCAQAYGPNEPNLPRGTMMEREVGLYGNIDRDIKLYFGDWGFDYIKIDGCGLRAYGASSDLVSSGRYQALEPILSLETVALSNIPAVQAMFGNVKAALDRYNPDGDYVLSLCIWGAANVRAWGKDIGNVSRTSDDITADWGRMLTNFDSAAKRPLYAHPGSWNDPDMLFVGKGDFDAAHLTEARSHFALWAMINAPLLIGSDLRDTPSALMQILGNASLISMNQDPAGNQAVLAFDSDDLQIFVKTLANGEKGVAIFNRSSRPIDANLTSAHLKFRKDAPVRLVDQWTDAAASFSGETVMKVMPRETLVFRARGVRELADGIYLSEIPGSVNPAVDGVTLPQPDPTIHRALAPWGGGSRGVGPRPMYAGWGGAQADATPFGRELQISGQRYAHGLGILANSRMEVRNADFRRLTVTVGVDDSASDARHAVTFEIYGDGRLLGRSAPHTQGTPAQQLSVDIDNVRLIELVARAPGVVNEQLPVSWADAAFHR